MIPIINKRTKEQIREQREQENDRLNKLSVWRISDLKSYKQDRKYIIERLLYPKEILMFVSKPGGFKSLLIQTIILCILYGKRFLGLKTRSCNLLLSDQENSNAELIERFTFLSRGLKIFRLLFRKEGTNIYFDKEAGNFDDSIWRSHIRKIIKEKKIKVWIIDTFIRFGNFDENSSRDISRIYTEVLKPLIDDFGISIIILHHTTKEGKGYRGSGDLAGMVTTAYIVERKEEDKFTIRYEKMRGDHIQFFEGNFIFGVNDWILEGSPRDYKPRTKISLKKRDFRKKILSCFKNQKEWYKFELSESLGINHNDSSFKRTLKELVAESYLLSPKRGTYKIGITNEILEKLIEGN